MSLMSLMFLYIPMRIGQISTFYKKNVILLYIYAFRTFRVFRSLRTLRFGDNHLKTLNTRPGSMFQRLLGARS